MLEARGIHIFRGEAQILWDLSLKIERGEVVTLLGANGAGKTTFLESVLGIHHPVKGDIIFLGKGITALPPHHISRSGISVASIVSKSARLRV